jgi:hypothetical protein
MDESRDCASAEGKARSARCPRRPIHHATSSHQAVGAMLVTADQRILSWTGLLERHDAGL